MRKTIQTSSIGVMILAMSAFGQNGQPLLDAESQAKVAKGLAGSPVPLNLTGKDVNLVGYGSYLVNFVAECNGCHSAGAQSAYAPGGNPYLRQYPRVNPATYLGGGNDFGAFPDPAGPFPHIVSRNLTPDKSGKPIGGDSLQDFFQVMRTGMDPDKLHPTCAGKPDGKCLPAPFSGDLLQIMPWPAYQNMTDLDITAIYNYLSAIPCVEDDPKATEKRCGTGPGGTGTGAKTVAVASPKGGNVFSRQLQLDGSQSTSADGKPLTYLWTIPAGSPAAAMQGATTATPAVQLVSGRGLYSFLLTVTDSTGGTATDTVTVNFLGN